MVHRRVAASPSRTTPDQVVHVSTPLRLGDEINASLPPIPVPRQRSTFSFPPRAMTCLRLLACPVSATAVHFVLLLQKLHKISGHERGREARKDKNA